MAFDFKRIVDIRLRPALSGDDEFLFSVYVSTRAEEMDLVDWNAAQKKEFLQMQFRAQDQYYKENYPGAEYQIILFNNRPVGRLYIHRRNDEIRIMDIALLSEYREQRIGTFLLQNILAEAAGNSLPVTIHVERFNPAMKLYKRLGFSIAEDKGVYLFLRWSVTREGKHEIAGSIAEH